MSDRPYLWLLFLYPRAFRQAHGREMCQVARASLAAARRAGALATSRVWLDLLTDLFHSAPREWLAARRARVARTPGPSPVNRDPHRGRGAWLDDVSADLRFTARMMRRTPAFTLAAVTTLALGIGGNTAIYSLVDATLLRPLPVREPDRLVELTNNAVSYPDFRDYGQRTDVLEGLAAFAGTTFSALVDATPQLLDGAYVSGTYFSTLGVEPAIGRIILSADDAGPGSPVVVMISYTCWQRLFGADRNAVGRSVQLNGRAATVVGVAARDFRGASLRSNPQLWVPLSTFPALNTHSFFADLNVFGSNRVNWLRVVGRLRPGVTQRQAAGALDAVYLRNHPKAVTEPWAKIELTPLNVSAVGARDAGDLRRFLLLLGGVVGFALLVACANLANMLLARATTRRREMGIRLALGAGRTRLVRQLLLEGALLAAIGSAGALGISRIALRLLYAFDLPGHVAIGGLNLRLSPAALGATALLTVATTLLFCTAPALRASGGDPLAALRDQVQPLGRHRLRQGLIAAQVALSLALLAGGGLFLRGLQRALAVDLGYDPRHVALATVDLGLARYERPRAATFYRDVVARLAADAEVDSAAWTRFAPFGGNLTMDFQIAGRTVESGEIDINFVDPGYFRTLGIPVRQGREFNDRDAAGSPLVTVVSDSMARRYWPGHSPLGQKLRMGDSGPWMDVVGVTADARAQDLASEPIPTCFLAFAQHPELTVTDRAALLVRAAGSPARVLPLVAAAIHTLDPALPIGTLSTMDDHVLRQLTPQRMGVTLFGFFGVMAVVLCTVGIHAVCSYVVAQRTREIGIRMALGAGRVEVLRLVIGHGIAPTILGIVAGLGLTIWASRLATAFLYGLEPRDAVTYASVVGLLGVIATVAAFLPARRATRIDPMVALRDE